MIFKKLNIELVAHAPISGVISFEDGNYENYKIEDGFLTVTDKFLTAKDDDFMERKELEILRLPISFIASIEEKLEPLNFHDFHDLEEG